MSKNKKGIIVGSVVAIGLLCVGGYSILKPASISSTDKEVASDVNTGSGSTEVTEDITSTNGLEDESTESTTIENTKQEDSTVEKQEQATTESSNSTSKANNNTTVTEKQTEATTKEIAKENNTTKPASSNNNTSNNNSSTNKDYASMSEDEFWGEIIDSAPDGSKELGGGHYWDSSQTEGSWNVQVGY